MRILRQEDDGEERPVPPDDIGLELRDEAEPDEGPSAADIEASERAASGSGWNRRFAMRAGVVLILIALMGMIVPSILLLWPRAASGGVAAVQPARTPATVTSVIDGRTILVQMDGKPYVVRYLGVELPKDEPWRSVAAEVNRQWVEGKAVMLEKDVTETDSDGYLPRYVWVGSQFINASMLAVGLGLHLDEAPDQRYSSYLQEFEDNARADRLGMWETRGA